MVRILLVDDHKMFRDALRELINGLDGFQVRFEAGNGLEAMQYLNDTEIDIIICDIHMPKMNGIELLEKVRLKHPDIKVIILSMDADKLFVDKVRKKGAHGFITKATGADQLNGVLNGVMRDHQEFQLVMSQNELQQMKLAQTRVKNQYHLTAREKEILVLIAEGLTDKEIARKVFLSPYTVITHRKSLLSKLGMHNKVELTRFAYENNLI